MQPGKNEEVEEADDSYEVDVADEAAVEAFVKEYQLQYNDLDALALLVGGFAMGSMEETSKADLDQMIQLNFLQCLSLSQRFSSFDAKAE